MDSEQVGEELGQLSRILFDEAAADWYGSAAIQAATGFFGAVLTITGVTGDLGLVGAILGLALMGLAYYLRLRFQARYDLAETMRRQSVLTEALGWGIDRVQVSEWRRRAGRKTLDRFKRRPREEDYYSTRLPTGPARLAEMTLESTFYTRHLYGRLRHVIWWVFAGAVIASVLVLALPGLEITSQSIGLRISTFVYLILPVLLTLDLLGWAIRLGGLMSGIYAIEADLQRLIEGNSVDVGAVLRLVSEYNCQVAAGFRIHPRLFARYHSDIEELWRRRSE